MTLQDLISEADWAAQRGVSLRTTQRERALRIGPPFIKIGRKIFYRPAAIESWLLAKDALVEPIQAALEQAREEARTLGDEQLARALQCLATHHDWRPDARLVRNMAMAAIEHIRADRIRQRLLTHYGTKEPTRFCQVAGWLEGDSITGCDADGNGLTMGATYELMGGGNVRVLIPDGIKRTPEEFARLIRKVADWVATPGNLDNVRQMRAAHEAPRPADFANPDHPF